MPGTHGHLGPGTPTFQVEPSAPRYSAAAAASSRVGVPVPTFRPVRTLMRPQSAPFPWQRAVAGKGAITPEPTGSFLIYELFINMLSTV